ncbi:cell division protein FtsA [Salipaludibacillus sp. LMS25]|jgi:cell division protein FtsA|uniref:cell division protein FtsA n=1 Tax=Salipaludibacillus sp. LMS25 TaxID=2924031 RepID=UPI0020D101A7|nr:cell division protein FtsA [Salipaludibacillus sp. LMS25]UTR15180.1 cell division protein FtsA [Salipaludibacillus sp. LMS25]
MKNHDTYVTLDIGTSSVRVIIGEMTNASLNIIGVGEAESEGIKKGSIVDIDETVQSIQSAVDKAERMIGLSIKHVVVGITGNHIQLQPCHGVVAVSSDDREIGDEDITRVIDAAQVVSIPPERDIIDVIPRQFIVDGLDEINDPRGMIGVRLEMEGTIITGAKTMLHNLLRCVEKAGLEVADIVLQPLAAGSIALSKDEKSLGVALIDLGGGSTTVSVFEDGLLQGTRQIPIGGDHISNDISVGLRTSTEEAENVKKTHGHAFVSHASDEETFEVSEIGSDQRQEFSQWQLANIIEPRLEEMFNLVMKEIYRMGYQDLSGGFVLTGGVAKMPGILELARDVMQKNVRVAIPDYIGVREPQYTNGVGLITFAHKNLRIQGKEAKKGLETGEEVTYGVDKRERKENPRQGKVKEPKEGPGVKKKVSNMFKMFFE